MNKPVPFTAAELRDLARLEWRAAVELGCPFDLNNEDREYQQRCFERAEEYQRRANKLVEAK